MGTNTYSYEQPTDETTRLCLRLENLFSHLNLTEPLDQRSVYLAIDALSHLLNATDRSDINGKLQELCSKQRERILYWQRSPGVDIEKTESMLNNIQIDATAIKKNPKKPGEKLRQNPFFNMLRSQIQSPNGLAAFNVPQYNLWARQSETRIKQCLEKWREEFITLNNIVTRSLQLIRSNFESLPVTAQRGMHQHSLNPSAPYELFRIQLTNPLVYPSISASQHQLNIQLHKISENDDDRSQKSYDNEPMIIQLCRH